MVWDDVETEQSEKSEHEGKLTGQAVIEAKKELKKADEQYSFSELKQDKEAEEFYKEADAFDKQMEEKEKSKNAIEGVTLQEHETILMFSQPKVGKTWAACSFIDQTLKDEGNIYYINTDNGFERTAKTYFKTNFENMKKSLHFYFIQDLDQIDKIVSEIKSKVKHNDLIVIDLIDDFWEKAQIKFMDEASKALNITTIDYLIMSNKEGSKIAGLAQDKWVYIKKFDNIVLQKLVITPPCTVIACCSSKDLDVAKIWAKKDADKMYELSKYEEIGSRPAGQPLLRTKFNTIVYIGEKKDGKRYFVIMGDRGFMKTKDRVEYNNNFYEAFTKLRSD